MIKIKIYKILKDLIIFQWVPGMVTHTFNPNTLEKEAGTSDFAAKPGPYTKF